MAKKRKGRKITPQAVAAVTEELPAPSAPAAAPTPSRPSSPSPESRWRRHAVCLALAVVVAFGVFANSLSNDFVYDDTRMIRDNPLIDHAGDVTTFFTTSYWEEVAPDAKLYRPLTVWSFAVDRALWGPGPRGVHAVNVVLNCILTALLYVFLTRLTGRRGLALLTALLFTCHPVHTEVVANGVGRAELGAAVFTVLALLAHLAVDEFPPIPGEPAWRVWRWPALSAGAYLVALLFKESAVVFPALALLMDILLRHRGQWRKALPAWPIYAVYIATFAAYMGLRLSVIGAATPPLPEVMQRASWLQLRLHGSRTMLDYLWQLLYPRSLCADYRDYRHLVGPSLSDPMVLLSLAAWPAWAGLSYWLIRRRQWLLLFAIGWFFLAILPASNLLISIGTPRADRILFLPSLGFALALAAGLLQVGRLKAWLPALVAAPILAAYGWRCISRNRDWRSDEALWVVTVRDNPGCAMAWRNLGDIYRKDGRTEQGKECLETAVKLRDGAGYFYPEAHIHLGHIYREAGQPDKAIAHYRAVVHERPGHFIGVISLAQMLSQRPDGRDEAIELCRRAVAIEPRNHNGYGNLANAYYRAGRYQEALAAIDKAMTLSNEKWLSGIRAKVLGKLKQLRDTKAGGSQAAGHPAATSPP